MSVKEKSGRPRTARVQSAAAKTKTIIYHGYEFRVPASWPVYRLDEHPSACVRYDINAVYLGTPGANMKCPSGIIGRAQTVTVIPGTTVAAGSGSEVTYQREQPDSVGGTRVRSLTAVHAAVISDVAQHELRVALGAASLGATVLGTYGADPAIVEHVLATLRTAPKKAADTKQTGSLSALSAPATPSRAQEQYVPQSDVAAIVAARSAATGLAAPTTTSWHGLPADWPIQIVSPPPPAPKQQLVSGFDTCNAPTPATMLVWHRDYAAAGVYIGGENMGCYYGNLSASWVKSAAAMGFGLLPIFVGKQAPCTQARKVTTIEPGHVMAEAHAGAAEAVADARYFGLPKGSPIYYDMEGFGSSASCISTVLTYLGAWDRAVAGAGYVTGVYSSMDSGIADMQAATIAKTAGFTPPVAVWIAQWDGVRSLGDENLGDLVWPLTERAKQYEGIVNQTIGGIELNIDLDVVGSPLAR